MEEMFLYDAYLHVVCSIFETVCRFIIDVEANYHSSPSV